MKRKSSFFVAFVVFILSAALCLPGAYAKKSKYFVVDKCKINNKNVTLNKPKKGVSKAAKISQSVSATRPKIKLEFDKLKKGKSTIKMTLEFTPVDTNDQRRITMTAAVIVKTDKKGKKITLSKVKGNEFKYTGTLSDGSPANGGTLDVNGKDALTARKKTCTLNSEVLLNALTAEDKIGQIGKQVGDYTYKLTLSGAKFKLKKRNLKKIKGTLSVTE
ncbi:MAG: hypothetical protein D6734_02540 [Candidatus Schekmanbacteria bacterium]|nr:MAG: hypothetical protein D6734_02540 [Candidatus Schekmanbacteria bacterium]